MTDVHDSEPLRGQGRPLIAVVLVLLLLGTAAGSQQQADEEALRLFYELYQLKSELMARLSADDPDAVPLAEKVLELSKQLLGPQHPEIVNGMTHVAFAHHMAGEMRQARSYFEQALELAERLLGPEHPTTAVVLTYLGALQQEQGELESARQRLERALAIQEHVAGPDSLEVALALNNLGNLSHAMGDLAGARSRLTRVVEILEDRLGPDHVETATARNNLAMVLLEAGDLTGARGLMEKALAANACQLGAEHPSLATDLNNMGRVLHEMEDLVNARRSLEQALEISEKALPPDHPSLAATLVNLAGVLNDLGLHEEAAKHLEHARDIQIRVYGPDHPQLLCTLTSLGQTARLQGEDALAKKDFDRAREIVLQQPSDRALGTALNTGACALIASGDAETAVRDLRQALAIVERTRPPDHPDRITAYLNLAQALDAAGEPLEAIDHTVRALDLEERALGTMVGLGSLRGAGLFLDQLRRSTAWAVGLHVRSRRPQALRLALTTVLRRKGRELETSARPYGTLDDPEADELRAALRRTREAWAFLDLRPFDPLIAQERTKEWCRLTDRVDLLSRELRKVHHRFGRPPPAVTIEAVQERLPDRAALIELFLFYPLTNPRTPSQAEEAAPHYLAYVLHRRGEPAWADLGDAETLDLLVAALRESLAQRSADVKTQAQRLDQQTMAKVRPLLAAGVDTLLLSPDGALNLVPFAALVDENSAYLLERYRVSYLSSGRDLLRDEEVPSREPPLIVGAPAHEAGPETWSAGTSFESLPELEHLRFAPLPGAEEEAGLVAATLGLPPERVLVGDAARESTVKGVRGPRILHLATHGFFLGDPTPDFAGPPKCLDEDPGVDPLLRSGLILSAPGHPATAAEDGLLTAYEAMDLDLAGTEIVTLSACETGVGEVRPGSGVHGLRRALVVAGARTQVMSLWRVADRTTAALMTSWYAQLAAGKPRGEALREAQLAFLQDEPLPLTGERGTERLGSTSTAGTDHPYFWASFMLAGDAGPITRLKED